MNIAPLKYLVCTDNGVLEVDGYAIDWGLPIRLTVRQKPSGHWVMDHYDTGMWFGEMHQTIEEAIKAGVEMAQLALHNGDYASMVRQYNARREE